MKRIDPDKTIYELTKDYPELIDILAEMGFLGVKNPIMRNTLGRITSLREGCKKQGKSLEEILEKLKQKGFSV
ncbi:DUF1858 domain-containing protein [Pseudothermotoga sp.]|nr:DUF1858 domain-containing protein [Pseudothermotoga sp.]MCX7813560.1 DUF1858 domain-containing protein [Pseudothermotoga sp.]MDW8140036.1 DUF1858 domain-containing protein [Pseudothermotoga sp.]